MADWKKTATQLSCDVIIAGAGPAGISAAIQAREHGLDVIILDKADPKWSGSAGRGIDLIHSLGTLPSAQDAIKSSQISYTRCYDEPDLANENVIYRLWEREGWALNELEKYYSLKWYDGDYLWAGTGGPYAGKSIRFNGLDLKPQMAAQLKKCGAKILARTMMVDVLTNDGKTVGCTAVSTRTGEFYVITAPALVMATGSSCRHLDPELPAHYYKMKYHHCPSAITGDGMAAAYRAGAELANVDLMEGSVPHMDYTCITRGCLIGVRPIKTKEYTCDGEDLYTRTPNELDKRMYRTLDEMGKTPIYRGMDHLPDTMQKELEVNYIDEGFINLKLAGERGFNPRTHRFEVPRDKPYPPDSSAVQMPGLAVDENFMTTVPGLFAIGDAASCVGAVMSAIVSGYTVGDVIGNYVAQAGEIRLDDAQVQKQMDETLAPLSVSADEGTNPIEFECAVRQYDERYVGIFKSAGKLRAGLRRLASLKKEFIPKLYAANPHYLMRCIEAKNIADMAGIYMQACMSREETRGFFNRSDFQEKDPARDGKITYQRLENGVPVVEKRAAPKLKPEYAQGGKN
ncbi:MAG: FAD-dependent oxidoreductase [Oscillospiraceae bacterium]